MAKYRKKPVYWVVKGSEFPGATYTYVRDIKRDSYFGHAFDTEEEANQWSTPKMHAVEMEVE
ncbi:hypothetical protein [Leuconostoc gasicomitatum]|uniref:hypothetical protein n=1 Tax=Leuconostoc gasicomitatum TaxID=115778 RepID=UPI001CC80C4A|nr:hypothetical protein [Leuconostoc gasicomitatum]MBZ5971609.1 hypothetical protein [Leuconostoc gasicomitatum]